MTSKLTITRERLEEIRDCCWMDDLGLSMYELSELAQIALAAMDSKPVAWGNGCDKTVPAALRYLAENERPFGGESRFNAAHLYQLAREIELMAEAPLYRHAPELTATVERLNASGYEYEGGEVTPQNVSAVVDILLQQLDDAVQGQNTQPEPEREPVKRFNADQMHRICLEANRHLDKYSAMAKEVNKLLGRIPAQPAPVVDADDNFYSWFGREWAENYQHNQYTTAAKQMLGVMAESAWKAGRRAAMLQAGNSPVIPEGESNA